MDESGDASTNRTVCFIRLQRSIEFDYSHCLEYKLSMRSNYILLLGGILLIYNCLVIAPAVPEWQESIKHDLKDAFQELDERLHLGFNRNVCEVYVTLCIQDEECTLRVYEPIRFSEGFDVLTSYYFEASFTVDGAEIPHLPSFLSLIEIDEDDEINVIDTHPNITLTSNSLEVFCAMNHLPWFKIQLTTESYETMSPEFTISTYTRDIRSFDVKGYIRQIIDRLSVIIDLT